MGIFSRLFGRKRQTENAPLGQFKSEDERRRAEEAVGRARALGQRAAQAEQRGREQAASARQRGQEAGRRGDRAGAQQARQDEQTALEFAGHQRRERQDQERRARDAEHKREQAVIESEKSRAKARQALLETRAEQIRSGEWSFAGPAPKNAEVYKNIKSGEGTIPDQQMFLLGHPYTAFASSNVLALQYDLRKEQLYIQYVKSGWYCYSGVNKAEALSFYHAPSKGIAVFDSIRVRGQNPRLKSPPAATRKRFKRNCPPPADLPLSSSAAAFAVGGGGL